MGVLKPCPGVLKYIESLPCFKIIKQAGNLLYNNGNFCSISSKYVVRCTIWTKSIVVFDSVFVFVYTFVFHDEWLTFVFDYESLTDEARPGGNP